MAYEPEDTRTQDEEQDELEQFYTAVEVFILSILCRRLAKLGENPSYVAMMEAIPKDLAAIAAAASAAETHGAALLFELLNRLADANDDWAAKFYEAAKVAQKRVADNLRTGWILKEAKRTASRDMRRYLKSDAWNIPGPDGKLSPMRAAYLAHCQAALSKIQAGMEPEQAIRDAVKILSAGGIRVKYSSGATRELYSAVSMNVMDAYRQCMDELREAQADEFGADGVQVSAHSMCAPDHLPYQGRQFSNAEFEKIQNSLGREIGHGMNCRHSVHRVRLGVGAYTSKQLGKMRRRSERKVDNPQGGTMTAYEFTQWQRAQETAIRKRRMKAQILDAAGLHDDAEAQRQRIMVSKRNYDQWSKRNGVPTRHERMEVYDWKP